MSPAEFFARRKTVQTACGSISYVEQGSGPVALFVHGVLLNGWLWRHQLAALGDTRRCIALDLLGHGHSEAVDGQDFSVTAQAEMLAQFLDALNIAQVDLVGNDSGGGICQIFAARHPQRLRSLSLTNCDTHDNWPPEAFKGFVEMVAAGGLPDTLKAMLADKAVFRTALAPAYEHPELVSDATIDAYLQPLMGNARRTEQAAAFVNAFCCSHTVAVEEQLKQLRTPTLIAWGTDDVYFDVKWSRWLERTIPGTRRRIELDGARIFFPEERSEVFNRELRAHWAAAVRDKAA